MEIRIQKFGTEDSVETYVQNLVIDSFSPATIPYK